jgi:hypothetical protein
MATGFSAPRSKWARAETIRCQRDKETMVARRAHQQTQPREIRVTFEPSRLSRSSVAQAYEQVVPIIHRMTSRPSSSDRPVPQEVPRSWSPGVSSAG